MALISCPECGKQISDAAKACPNCGCPVIIKTNDRKVNMRHLLVGIFFILIGIVLIWLSIDVRIFDSSTGNTLGLIMALTICYLSTPFFILAFCKLRQISTLWLVVGVLLFVLSMFIIYDYYRLHILDVHADDAISSTTSVVFGITGVIALITGLVGGKRWKMLTIIALIVSVISLFVWIYNKCDKAINRTPYEVSRVDNNRHLSQQDLGWEYIQENVTIRDLQLKGGKKLDEETCAKEDSPLKDFEGISMYMYYVKSPTEGEMTIYVFFKDGTPCFLSIGLDNDWKFKLLSVWRSLSPEDKIKEDAADQVRKWQQSDPTQQQWLNRINGM